MSFALLLAVLAFRGVTVIDAAGPRPNSNVVIDNGRVVAAGAAVGIPKGARVIDGKGKFLIPGLWDMHVHLWESDPMAGLYLAAGVTGVRDMGSDPAKTLPLRDRINTGKSAGPLIYTPGPPIDEPGAKLPKSPLIAAGGPVEARAAVDTVDEAKLDFVKVLSGLSEDAYRALAQRARVRRIPFAGHLPEAVTAWDAIDQRQKSIDHLFGLALSCSSDEMRLRRERAEAIAKRDGAKLREVRERTFATFTPMIASELFRRMARFGVWQAPTLTLRKRMSLLDLDRLANAPELSLVPQAVRATWEDPREDLKRASPAVLENYRRDYEFHARLVLLAHRAGAGLLAGTDTGDPYVVPGFALHDELEALVEAGLTPAEALSTATLQPARYFGIEDSYGTIESGRVASLVLLDADPLADIRNTRRIAAVVHRGRLLDAACLDSLRRGESPECALAPVPTRPAPKPPPARRRSRAR